MKKYIISLIIVSILAFVAAVGCSSGDTPNTSNTQAASTATSDDAAGDDHMGYTTAEQCFECHGSYAEHAETTAYLGDWNPHDSIHGGYVDCMNCHTFKKLERNYCAYCHDYKPDMNK